MDSDLFAENPILAALPPHLKQFIKPQNYHEYTAIDQSVWRYVMRQNVRYLSQVAHESYVEGLKKTGISIERIPNMYGMNRILKEIGWAAVAVDGFIPPNAFMEFQAYKVLVIAADIRKLENIEYTPAPDIIHESAGHAPIIANPGYAEYLRRLGAIGAKAILSRYDIDLYEAVRSLSILKESKSASEDEIMEAQTRVEELQVRETVPSEMAMVRNLQWWTVEYGLIGEPNDFKIYGAGLLSSIGESASCMDEAVKKLSYSVDAAKVSFDITKPQPQLFVTPSFAHLMEVLEEFANTLSVRRGGHHGVQKLIDSGMVGSIALSTGLQISGQFQRMILNEEKEVVYIETKGPTALAYRERELIGHGTTRYANGFKSPLGDLKSVNLAIEDMGPVDLAAYGFRDGEWLAFEFASGIHVEGRNVTGIRNVSGKLLLIQMVECTVRYGDEILRSPDKGVFDMAIGKSVTSAFAGAADYRSFPNLYHESLTSTSRPSLKIQESLRNSLYGKVRIMREEDDHQDLELVLSQAITDHSDDWLLILQLLEISQGERRLLLQSHLERIAEAEPALEKLILDGIQALA